MILVIIQKRTERSLKSHVKGVETVQARHPRRRPLTHLNGPTTLTPQKVHAAPVVQHHLTTLVLRMMRRWPLPCRLQRWQQLGGPVPGEFLVDVKTNLERC